MEHDSSRCRLSTSWQRSCQTDESAVTKCETIKRTYQMCPGQLPALVQEERVREDGEHNFSGALPDFPRSGGDPFGNSASTDPFHMMHQMEQRMTALMGGLLGAPLFGAPSQGAPHPQHLPPQPPPEQPPPRPRVPMRVHET